ncbi:DUF4221 domain-containing protein [Algoriphagus machipongonensis]|uniref:Lipoprotein n=1 Tax=Algoriphagus machipongonensis TaxID=388413 RepID=A3HXM1_9BACT|nr:DUF4221 domain-containing protein [Algoriphagus machipongonensis]EAZ81344.1 hypothetical protein ALPR1_19948 [Algoriphagus machipongonensis]
MRLKNPFLLLLFGHIFLLISCGGQKDKKEITYFLEASGELLEFELDSLSPNQSNGIQFFDPFLFSLDMKTSTIHMYDKRSGKLNKSLQFEEDGPNGISDIFGFKVQSLDSIYLFSLGKRLVAQTDTSAQIINKTSFELPEPLYNIFLSNTFYNSPARISEGIVYGKTRASLDLKSITQEKLNEVPLIVGINIKDGSVKTLPYRFPSDYLKAGLKSLEASVIQANGQTVISFFGDHRLYVSHSDAETLQAVAGKSQFLDEVLPTFSNQSTSLEFATYNMTKSRYGSLIFDPYKKLYYRFAYPTIEVSDIQEIRTLNTSPGPFVLMVFDKELNLLREKRFEEGKYFQDNFFVTKDGLYLSTSHPKNPANMEDIMTFELVKLNQSNE